MQQPGNLVPILFLPVDPKVLQRILKAVGHTGLPDCNCQICKAAKEQPNSTHRPNAESPGTSSSSAPSSSIQKGPRCVQGYFCEIVENWLLGQPNFYPASGRAPTPIPDVKSEHRAVKRKAEKVRNQLEVDLALSDTDSDSCSSSTKRPKDPRQPVPLADNSSSKKKVDSSLIIKGRIARANILILAIKAEVEKHSPDLAKQIHPIPVRQHNKTPVRAPHRNSRPEVSAATRRTICNSLGLQAHPLSTHQQAHPSCAPQPVYLPQNPEAIRIPYTEAERVLFSRAVLKGLEAFFDCLKAGNR